MYERAILGLPTAIESKLAVDSCILRASHFQEHLDSNHKHNRQEQLSSNQDATPTNTCKCISIALHAVQYDFSIGGFLIWQ